MFFNHIKMSDDIVILTFSIIGIFAGLGGIIYLGYRNGYLNFLGLPEWISLLLLIIAGIITWTAMVWIVNNEFNVTNNQWISLGFSIAISILWWARYTYTVNDGQEDDDDL